MSYHAESMQMKTLFLNDDTTVNGLFTYKIKKQCWTNGEYIIYVNKHIFGILRTRAYQPFLSGSNREKMSVKLLVLEKNNRQREFV